MASSVPIFLGHSELASNGENKKLGTALLLAGLDALRAQGYAYGIIGWAGPVGFFEKTVDATIIENSEPGIYRGMLANPDK